MSVSYITIAELIARFGEAEIINGNDPQNSGAINHTMLEARIADVTAEINFYLLQRDFTLDQLDENLRGLLKKIASDLIRASYFQPELPTLVREAETRARMMLNKIADGQLDLRDLGHMIQMKQGDLTQKIRQEI